MGGYIKRNVERVETAALNTKINREVFNAFKDYCKEQGYPMNVVIETFMKQYVNKRFKINTEDITKFESDKEKKDTLNTTFSKEIYYNFKSMCEVNGFHVKNVISAFMEIYANRNYILEYVEISKVKAKDD
jgi:antitoxin component of RelBE/YafQ-DinJ toxin-antitoxin module